MEISMLRVQLIWMCWDVWLLKTKDHSKKNNNNMLKLRGGFSLTVYEHQSSTVKTIITTTPPASEEQAKGTVCVNVWMCTDLIYWETAWSKLCMLSNYHLNIKVKGFCCWLFVFHISGSEYESNWYQKTLKSCLCNHHKCVIFTDRIIFLFYIHL